MHRRTERRASIHKQSNRSYWFASYRDADGRQHFVSTKILHTPPGNDAKERAGNAAKNRRLAQDLAMRLEEDAVAMNLTSFVFDQHVLKLRPQKTRRKKRDLIIPLHPQLQAHVLDLPIQDKQGALCPTLADNLDVDFVHQGFSTRVLPSLRRAVHRLLPNRLPAASLRAAAHGKSSSPAQCTQSRTTLTRRQCLRSVANSSDRNDLAPSMMLRVSSTPWCTPTSLSNSNSALSGVDTRTPSGVSGSGCNAKFFGSWENRVVADDRDWLAFVAGRRNEAHGLARNVDLGWIRVFHDKFTS
jgi:hypothetical protein